MRDYLHPENGEEQDLESFESDLAKLGIAPGSPEASALISAITDFAAFESGRKRLSRTDPGVDRTVWEKHQNKNLLKRAEWLGNSYGSVLATVAGSSSQGRADALDRLIMATYGELVTFFGDTPTPPAVFGEAQDAFDGSLGRARALDVKSTGGDS